MSLTVGSKIINEGSSSSSNSVFDQIQELRAKLNTEIQERQASDERIRENTLSTVHIP